MSDSSSTDAQLLPTCTPSLSTKTPAFPYTLDSWRAVDDRIRGGSSVSHLERVSPKQGHLTSGRQGVKFWGHLDTKTLGGAGFASQCHDFPLNQPLSLPSSLYSGLDLTFLPHSSSSELTLSTDGKGQESSPSAVQHLTLVLKTEFPAKREDGRNEAGVNWEVEIDFGLSRNGPVRDVVGNIIPHTTHHAFSSFIPTSKGRPLPPQSPSLVLDPSHIVSISLMARSSFGKQEGDFDFVILDLQPRARLAMGWSRTLMLAAIGVLGVIGLGLISGIGPSWR